jgi:hypothetical protein
LLFEHFQIQPGDWKALAIVLAQTHVPGLQSVTPERRGPKRFWTLSILMSFKNEMQDLIDGPRQPTISTAAAILAKRPHWKERLKQHQNPAEVLRRKYHQIVGATER